MNVRINEKAPAVQSKELVIHAKPEKVWEVLTDIDRWSDWNGNIKDPQTKEKPAAGSIFTWKNSGSKIVSEIHTLEQNRMLGWTGKNFAARAIHNWYLTPIEDGTKVRAEESMEGWIMGLMKKKMNEILAKDMIYWLEMLKIKCEE